MSTLARGVKGAIGAGIVPLLALAVFINYVDRGNLATAAPLIKDELHLTATQVGILLSAFYWTYTPSQLLAGWLTERFNPYRTLAAGLALWSLATAGTGLVTGFAALIALRFLLGVGESAAFPCSSKLLAEHLPSNELGNANGLIAVGLALGPAFGTMTGGLLMAHFGWRTVFVVFGLVSLLWLWPWLATTRKTAADASGRPPENAPPLRRIMAKREAWGASLGHFSANYSFYFVVSWLPLYLVKARGFSVAEMAELGGLIYLAYAASAVTCGRICDWWMRAGASANLVRKCAIIFSQFGITVAMLGCALGSTVVSIASFFFASFAFGFGTPTVFAIGQTLAGPRAAGKWIGLQNCVGNLAGIAAPIITGLVVDKTGQFFWAFAAAGAVSLAGIFAWGVMIRTVAPVSWDAAD